jgi:hypothetical protein
MPKVKFVNLFLLSQAERRALKVPLNSQRVIIQGGNGFGKSAIIKSLYDTLGATPPKIDERWKLANVSSCLEFEFAGQSYAAVKTLGLYSLFDGGGRILFSGQRLVKDWGPQLATFFGFKLEMSEVKGDIVTPPPAYIFAPFYVDQDAGWTKAWTSFVDYYLPDSPRTLAEYHSGLKPDQYYSAKAGIAGERIELAALEAGVKTLRETIAQVQQIDEQISPTYDLAEFKSEIDDLVDESSKLLELQTRFRNKVSELHEEVHLLRSEKQLLEAAIAEMRGEFDLASRLPDEVECPTCGQGYHNGLADRFALIADEGVLIEALGRANAKLGQFLEQEKKERAKLGGIEDSLARINRTLEVQRVSLSFNDVIVAAGKTEAAKILRGSLAQKTLDTDDVRQRVDDHKTTMDGLTSARRTSEILKYFRSRLASFAEELDVQLDDPNKQSIAAIKVARGSEGPRALLAYYYAFLQTRALFSGSTSYPIVIDAPNQQGQDAVHLPQMLKFIFNHAPDDNQIIVATEDVGQNKPSGADVRTYGERKRQVLRDAEYEDVRRIFTPYTDAILAATREN